MKTIFANRSTKPRAKKTSRFASILIAVGALMLMFQSTLVDYVNGASAPDGIYIPNSTHQFSKIEAKEGMYRHTFRIYNLRPRQLTVEAHPDCGCTDVSWEKTTIAPFGWKELTAEMKADKSKVGNSVAVGFRSDSPRQPWFFAFLKS